MAALSVVCLLLAAASWRPVSASGEEFWPGQSAADILSGAASRRRYLLYDVNPPEGFNLRRDVYIRVASLLKTLLKTEEWVLVLPPWGRLYHWQSPDIHQVRIPWSEFFDLPSLNKNIPVIEYEQFIAGEAGISLGGFSDVDSWLPGPACPGTFHAVLLVVLALLPCFL
uniref:GDP-fucose protein O-fucosyltransferase 2 n=1 Tax=Mus musculus TaxID=10090 RepID=Q3UHF9_MOUSE|nr:unnamed protein product [Mus musculus]